MQRVHNGQVGSKLRKKGSKVSKRTCVQIDNELLDGSVMIKALATA